MFAKTMGIQPYSLYKDALNAQTFKINENFTFIFEFLNDRYSTRNGGNYREYLISSENCTVQPQCNRLYSSLKGQKQHVTKYDCNTIKHQYKEIELSLIFC